MFSVTASEVRVRSDAVQLDKVSRSILIPLVQLDQDKRGSPKHFLAFITLKIIKYYTFFVVRCTKQIVTAIEEKR